MVKANAGRCILELTAMFEEKHAAEIPAEFERMFRNHSGLVFRTAYRITGNASDAEDVLQDVFMRFLRRGAEAAPVSKEESYFRRAAINRALDAVRRRVEERSIPLEEMPAEPSREETGLKDALRAALAKLAPRDAEVFTLRFFEDYTNPEIARMLGISQVLVAVTVHRARRKLRKEMGGI